MNALMLRTRLNMNIDAGAVVLRCDIDVGRRIPARCLAVGAEIICAFRHVM